MAGPLHEPRSSAGEASPVLCVVWWGGGEMMTVRVRAGEGEGEGE